MKLNPHKCPECGGLATGAVDWTPSTADFADVDPETGEWEDYAGESEMHWDGQTNDADLRRVHADPGGLLAACEALLNTPAMNVDEMDPVEIAACELARAAIAKHKAAVPGPEILRVQCSNGHEWDAAVERGAD